MTTQADNVVLCRTHFSTYRSCDRLNTKQAAFYAPVASTKVAPVVKDARRFFEPRHLRNLRWRQRRTSSVIDLTSCAEAIRNR